MKTFSGNNNITQESSSIRILEGRASHEKEEVEEELREKLKYQNGIIQIKYRRKLYKPLAR